MKTGNLSNLGVAAMFVCAGAALAQDKAAQSAGGRSVHDFSAKNIDGKEVKLSSYAGDVLLIVNVASKCGYTDGHYKELEPLFRKYKSQGFRVLAFPCNDFGKQEPGTAAEIKAFCSSKYDVTFDLFDKISVKGDDKHPLFAYLTTHPNKEIAGEIKWNFNKFLIGHDGQVLGRFNSDISPSDPKLIAALEAALKAKKPK